MYGGAWSFIKTIIFAMFVTTCKKRKEKKKDREICLIYSISILQLYQKWLNY